VLNRCNIKKINEIGCDVKKTGNMSHGLNNQKQKEKEMQRRRKKKSCL